MRESCKAGQVVRKAEVGMSFRLFRHIYIKICDMSDRKIILVDLMDDRREDVVVWHLMFKADRLTYREVSRFLLIKYLSISFVPVTADEFKLLVPETAFSELLLFWKMFLPVSYIGSPFVFDNKSAPIAGTGGISFLEVFPRGDFLSFTVKPVDASISSHEFDCVDDDALPVRMQNCIDEEDYEKAARVRDEIARRKKFQIVNSKLPK